MLQTREKLSELYEANEDYNSRPLTKVDEVYPLLYKVFRGRNELNNWNRAEFPYIVKVPLDKAYYKNGKPKFDMWFAFRDKATAAKNKAFWTKCAEDGEVFTY